MHNEKLSEVADVVVSVKEALESKSYDELLKLLTSDTLLNVAGRFYTAAQLNPLLQSYIGKIESPSIEIGDVGESIVGEADAFTSFVATIGWIDPQTWEEQSIYGLASFQLLRDHEANWKVRGFTFTPKHENAPEVDIQVDTTSAATQNQNGFAAPVNEDSPSAPSRVIPPPTGAQ